MTVALRFSRALSFTLATLALAVAPASAETLEQALISAYEHNPQILAERANLRAVDENVPQALAGWRPTVAATATDGYQDVKNSPQTAVVGGSSFKDTQNSVDVTVTQPVFNSGRTVAQTSVAENQVKAERARNTATEETVFFSVIQAYLDVLRDTAIVDLGKQNETALQQMLDANTGRYKLGELTRTDVAQTQARLSAATAERQTDEGTLEASRANYVRFVGHEPSGLVEPQLHPQLPTTMNQAVSLASTENPAIAAAIFTTQAAKDTVTATRAQLLPSVAIVADGNRAAGASGPGLKETRGSIVAQLTVPFYDAGVYASQTRQAIERVGQSQSLADDARLQAVQGAQQAWQAVVAARASIKSLQDAVSADTLALEGLHQEQLSGLRLIIDILNGQQELLADKVALVRAQHDLRLAEFNLAQQVGRLTAATLHLQEASYDPQKHYDDVRDQWLGLDLLVPRAFGGS